MTNEFSSLTIGWYASADPKGAASGLEERGKYGSESEANRRFGFYS